MKASDIMTEKVITASPDESVLSIVQKMLDNGISGVPVVDEDGQVAGIVSEGDLLHRPETETVGRPRSWWLDLFVGPETRANEFLKTHGTRASDIMTAPAVTATEDESAADIARKLERHRIKRVPIVRDGRLVGIVSRANLLRTFAQGARTQAGAADNAEVRAAIMERLDTAGIMTHLLGVTVTDDTVELWGAVDSPAQVTAARAAAEGAAPSRTVENHLSVEDRQIGYL